MMKKYLPYILILIIITGIFSPVSNIKAEEDPKGTCYKNAGEVVGENVTNAYCINTLKGEAWSVNENTTPVPINSNTLGSCYKQAGSIVTTNVTSAQCTASGGETWSANVTPKTTKEDTSYHLLEPLPCEPSTAGCELNKKTGRYELASFNPSGQGKLGQYLNFAIKLFIGLCAVAAVVMIVIGGIEYSSELISTKAAAKERILGAIFGLILALFSWLILYTINPDLLNTDVDIGEVGLVSEGEVTIKELQERIISVGGAITPKNSSSRGTVCDANVIFQSAQDSGHPITAVQAQTMSCIGGAESNCKAIRANVPGVTSSAFGAFQIVLTMHGRLFDNPVCQAAAGVPSGTPLRCLSRSSLCIKAASSLACQSAVASQLVLRQPNFRDWLQTQAPCRNAMCVRQNSPNVNLNISLQAIPGRGAISNLSQYCNLR